MAELSVLYAADCLVATADPVQYDAHVAHVSPDGSWRFPQDLSVDGQDVGRARLGPQLQPLAEATGPLEGQHEQVR